MKNRTIIGAILLMIFLSGCWASKSVMTTQNITQPVLVGNVKTIGEENINNENLQEGARFSAAIRNSIYFYTAIYSYGYTTTTEGSNVLEAQLLPLIDEIPGDKGSMLIVDQFRFDVMSGYWLFVLLTSNKGWIDGAKYTFGINEPKN